LEVVLYLNSSHCYC